MKTLAASIFAALILFVAPAALADGNGPNTLTLTNPGTNVMGGVYVGPYTFTATTAGGQQSQALLVCDDFKDDVYVGESWQAVTSTIPSLTNAQFSGLSQYEQVAYLTQELFANSNNPQAQADIQWAIWDIFDPGISSNDPYGTISAQDQLNIAGWLAAAQANAGSGDYADVLLFTPLAGTQPPQYGPPQEYVTVTPEPGTLALFGIGLVAFGIIAKRRMNASPMRQNIA